MSQAVSGITLRRWGSPNENGSAEPVFLMDGESLPQNLTHASIVLRTGGGARARELIARGAKQVLIGDAALLDSSLVETLARESGNAKVGLWIAARRMAVNWTLDSYSNADFRCMTPSYGKPAWEVVKSDGSGSGSEAGWWIGQMLSRGACTALVAVDMTDDDDLNICAELIEQFGASLWLTPITPSAADLADWVRFGQARNLAIRHLPPDDPLAMRALRQSLESAMEAVT